MVRRGDFALLNVLTDGCMDDRNTNEPRHVTINYVAYLSCDIQIVLIVYNGSIHCKN